MTRRTDCDIIIAKLLNGGRNMKESIKRFRLSANLSQEELARKLNLTQGLISQWELGICSPSASKLPALAEALGCTIDDLYRKED